MSLDLHREERLLGTATEKSAKVFVVRCVQLFRSFIHVALQILQILCVPSENQLYEITIVLNTHRPFCLFRIHSSIYFRSYEL